ncbi:MULTISPECIES: DUF6953 family protein [Enterobacteriaceae]|nr:MULTISPECIES: hypothetical protein [Enterobacteriaceae]EBU7614076.1 hypothetical protein [Salmonella enterica subsp. enterica serovar Agona]EKT8661481.1 hypothetical protein [Klebsiella quasipneumoniae]DAJ15559.1 MAG TPA: hypothetical protein [Peduovirinae sp. ctyQn5]HDS6124708.1 hypothetical protein [Klebsiella pneumoniae subsp. pneumoniae]EBV1811498.1 hypothetical protein [Salmonella enterica subsp. enterica serovar Agona]
MMNDSLIKIVDWMVNTTRSNGVLYQSEVVEFLINDFGDEFIKTNENGNYAISSTVLANFRKASKDDIVWDREQLAWRLRNESDLPGRMQ